jgi:IS30 family transposase
LVTNKQHKKRSPIGCTEFTTITNENKRLSRDERRIIERKLRERSSKAEIARLLGRDKSTILATRKTTRSGHKVYYAHPYSSFERGTNENWNGIVRRFVPKGSSFTNLTDDAVERIAYYINTLPWKRFGYKTPLAMWEKEVADLLAA